MKERDTVTLSASQAKALKFLQGGTENIFMTGGPGTGKSFLIKHFLQNESERIPVVASTGAAAILIGGRTFHSFFGLGIMQGGLHAVIERALKNGRLKKRIKDTHTLVMDEVSMLSAETFNCAEALSRIVRENEEPWGGMRVIAVGDFAQLPPITRSQNKEWCFLSAAWERSRFKRIELKEMIRTQDEEFLKILETIRWGGVSEDVAQFLDSRLIMDEEVEDDVPHLFPRRNQTDMFNKRQLERIQKPTQTFETEYGGSSKYRERMMKDMPIPPVLELKEGALVMLRINDPKQRFVNGTVGTVEEMFDDLLVLRIKKKIVEIEPFVFSLLDGDGEEIAFARNFPLNLAYGSTIHKIQGTTLDRVHIDLKSLWEPGQAYVALSRVRTGRGVTLMGWDQRSIMADPQVQSFYSDLE